MGGPGVHAPSPRTATTTRSSRSTGWPPAACTPTRCDVNGERVWPDGGGFPPSSIATLDPGRPLRLAFGSCRTSVPHDAAGNRTHGVDSLRAFALHLAGGRAGPAAGPGALPRRPGVRRLHQRPDAGLHRVPPQPREPPGKELKDYEEYAHLYRLAWSDPANRWLLSTLPTAMLFDDHDIRDDWNASLSWKRKMQADRLVAGPDRRRARHPTGCTSTWATSPPPSGRRTPCGSGSPAHHGAEELDLTEELDAFADRADKDPASYRWSYWRDFGDVRLIVRGLPRAARSLKPRHRGLLDEPEMALAGRADARRSPAPAGRHVAAVPAADGPAPFEAWNEALCNGRVGPGRPRRWANGCARRSTWSTGRRSSSASSGSRDGGGAGRRRARARAGDRHLPVRGRALLLCCGGGARARRPRSCRRCVRRCATRCRAGCGSSPRSCPTGAAAPVGTRWPAPQRSRTRRSRGTGSRGRGSTTTSPCWRRCRRGCWSRGTPASSMRGGSASATGGGGIRRRVDAEGRRNHVAPRPGNAPARVRAEGAHRHRGGIGTANVTGALGERTGSRPPRTPPVGGGRSGGRDGGAA